MFRVSIIIGPLVLLISQVFGSKKGSHAFTSSMASVSNSYISAQTVSTFVGNTSACQPPTSSFLTSTTTTIPCHPSTIIVTQTATNVPVTYFTTTVKSVYGTITVPATTVTLYQSGSAVTATITETITKQEFYTITEGAIISTMVECSGNDCPFGPGFKD
ncbi:hypothetical protein MMC26_006084 [Xylographa opegraphella]|nr:hypothetical protein [Xylographa opegraphella]